MRRASTLAGSSVAAAAFAFQSRLSQTCFYRTSTAASSAPSRWFPAASNESSARFASIGLLGALSVVGAASLFQEAYAKEPISADRLPKDVVLYQYEACPFCNKVKAFLDYYDVPYKVVEVNPLSKKEIKWSEYKKVPILVVDGEQMVDSSAIIDKFGEKVSRKECTKAVTDNNEEKKWRQECVQPSYLENDAPAGEVLRLHTSLAHANEIQWVDNHLVHVLSPNIYRNASEALESFDYFTSNDNFNFYEKYSVKYAGAAAMYFVSKKLKKKYNITDERKSLYEAAETWVDALDGREFHGGSKPNLADLAVYGVLRPIRYLTSGKDMVEHTRIGEWYGRMEREVGESTRIKAA